MGLIQSLAKEPKMAPHELHTSEVVSEQNGTIIDRCKNVVSTISQKAETFNWQEQIPSGLKENAQFAWEKVKDYPMVEKLVSQMKDTSENAQVSWQKVKEQTTMENLISQVKESPFWDLPPTALVLIGICLLPVASCISFFITSISLLFQPQVRHQRQPLSCRRTGICVPHNRSCSSSACIQTSWASCCRSPSSCCSSWSIRRAPM